MTSHIASPRAVAAPTAIAASPGARGAHAPVRTSAPADARYLLIKAKGGMGNRLLCAVTGMAWGRLAGRQTFVDWSDASYSDDGSNVFSRYFASPLVSPSARMPDPESIWPLCWAGHLDRSLSQMISTYDPRSHSSPRIHRKYSLDPHYLDYDAQLVVYWSYTERAYALGKAIRHRPELGWPSEPDLLLRHLLRREVAITPDVVERADAFQQAHFGAGPVIGMHVRYTDRTMNLDLALSHLRRILRDQPRARIFLATDSRACLERLAAEFPGLCSTPKWYPPADGTMHQSDSCPNRFENGIEALVDMLLLARCDWLIYPSRSTFSKVAALISDAPPGQIIDLDRRNLPVRAKRLLRRLLE